MVKHGNLTQSGKVKKQTPKVAPMDKKKKKTGRAKKRMLYSRRFLTTAGAFGKVKMNPAPTRA